MKRFLSCMLSFVMLLLPSLVLFSSCGGEGAEATTAEPSSYTVTFSVDGKVTTAEVPAGETPEYTGETSWETEEHFYKITGWDKEFAPATENVTYTAVIGEYGLTTYDIRFLLPGNDPISVRVHEGELPTPPAGYETDLSKVDKIGAFDHWSPDLIAPTAENMEGKKFVIYTPSYVYSTRYYNVKFVVGENEYEVETAGKKIPECPVDPADAVKNDITLRFAGWDKEVVAVTEDVTYTAVFESTAQILAAKDGAKGVLTMTYDDGRYTTAVWVNEENKKYGLNGSIMIVPNWSKCYPDFTFDGGSIDKWKVLFRKGTGTLEPQSHSMSHESTGILADETGNQAVWDLRKYNNYQENYKYEIVEAKSAIRSAFPGSDVICFAPSNNTLSHVSWASDGNGNLLKDANGNYYLVEDGGATKVAEATYYAIRKGNRDVQSLDPTLGREPGGWYNLSIRAFKDHDGDDKLVQGKKWLDETVRDGNWLIVMCHGISVGGGDIKQSLADQFFAYAGNYVKSGDLWCATFGDATKYIRERQNTTVSERYEDGTVFVDMKIDRTAGDGKYLAETVFDYPLTVEVRVPANWVSVSYENDEGAQTVRAYTRDGARYVKVNLTPGEDGVVVTTAIRSAD
ncbi:MAG: hypothetical protein IKP55_04025 [Clostridia bacterium]|nr:hypothetical protein [Clostridia bacterium]